VTTTDDGLVRGPVRAPVNAHQAAPNSIHNDEVASGLGFRGGTVAGSVHMDQFPPVLVAVFGEQWFETGSLSLVFRNATTSGEEVIAVVGRPDGSTDCQVEARMDRRDDGGLVAEGTASIGRPAVPTHLHSIDLRPSDPSDLVMFADRHAGDLIAEWDEAVPLAEAVKRADEGRITEALDWYTGPSPWGGPVLSPSSAIRLLWARASAVLTKQTGGAVGLFGAIELRHLAGPVFADQTYHVESRIAAVGASPKTEYVWFDSVAIDESGTEVASMRMQLRWMKASSSLYAAE
jgi:hypothetical protein